MHQQLKYTLKSHPNKKGLIASFTDELGITSTYHFTSPNPNLNTATLDYLKKKFSNVKTKKTSTIY